MNRTRRQLPAFTLLELILAMAMVAMLAVSLYATLNIAYKARATAERAIRPMRAATIATGIVLHDLGSIMVPSPESSDETSEAFYLSGAVIGEHQPSGAGSADWIEFYTLGTDSTSAQGDPLGEGIRRVDIGLRSDLNPPALVRRVTRNLLATTAEEPVEEVLCSNVASFALLYFDGYDWYDTWDSRLLEGALPIEIDMQMVLSIPNRQGTGDPTIYSIRRRIPIACGKMVDPTQTTQ